MPKYHKSLRLSCTKAISSYTVVVVVVVLVLVVLVGVGVGVGVGGGLLGGSGRIIPTTAASRIWQRP